MIKTKRKLLLIYFESIFFFHFVIGQLNIEINEKIIYGHSDNDRCRFSLAC